MDYLAVAFFTGCLAILLGVAPLVDLLDGLDQIRDSLLGSRWPLVRRTVNPNKRGLLDGQIWFAVGGTVLILAVLIAFLVS